MQLSLTVEGEDATSLHRWLTRDPDVAGHATVRLGGAPRPGEMSGGALDLVNVVLGNGIALTNLLVAVAAWRATRPRAPRVHVERDGVTVTVTGDDPQTVRALVAALERPEADGS